ncbi:MAG: dihydrolipoyl dehydrogenase [Deltaproteobacteria bacterium]|nr:dihydrolipoyl dehydrogenase [Deltaproteobacteria bacterium]
MDTYDVIVIGGGPGGYAAAARAAQSGMKTALVEKEALGGTCLNWGCIPTKSLLRNAEIIHLLSRGRAFGFSFDNLAVDYAAAHKRSRQVVMRQNRRVASLMKNTGVTLYNGMAHFTGPDTLTVSPSDTSLQAKHIIIATGALSRELPGSTFDGRNIINYRNALELTAVPKSALIVGAGPIGMEFATLWNRYNCRVTVVEAMGNALPFEDVEISMEAEKQFKRNGITIKTETLVEGISSTKDGVAVTLKSDDKTETLTVEMVLVAIGFTPNCGSLGLEKAGVAVSRGAIDVDEKMRTATPHIFAIGDVNGKMGLAHVASAQGIIAAETIAGHTTTPINYTDIPRCTYAHPEVASVGLTESRAREQGYDVITARCPFAGNGKAVAMDDNSGFVKIIAERESKKILGVHLVGGHVTELVAGATGMISLGATAEQLGNTVHPHPTLSESVMEAAQALCGQAIHV